MTTRTRDAVVKAAMRWRDAHVAGNECTYAEWCAMIAPEMRAAEKQLMIICARHAAASKRKKRRAK